MEHHRPRRYRGPGVWALVRDAYLAGEPAPKLAQRYDVGLANLRRKALTEGWTRRAHAAATDLAPSHTTGARLPAAPPPTRQNRPVATAPIPAFELPKGPFTIDQLGLVLDLALVHAARQLAEGRGGEAQSTLKAVAALRDLHREMRAATDALDREEAREEAREEDGGPDTFSRALNEIWAQVEGIAESLLADRSRVPSGLSLAALHWRATRLGPSVAASDHAQATAEGWATRFYDEAGRLNPLPGSPPL